MGYLAGKRKPRIGTYKEETCQQGISCSINEESESLSESPSAFELANILQYSSRQSVIAKEGKSRLDC